MYTKCTFIESFRNTAFCALNISYFMDRMPKTFMRTTRYLITSNTQLIMMCFSLPIGRSKRNNTMQCVSIDTLNTII